MGNGVAQCNVEGKYSFDRAKTAELMELPFGKGSGLKESWHSLASPGKYG